MNSLTLAKKRAKIEKGQGRSSKLDEHYEAIKYLLFEENYNLKQVQNFLIEDCNCQVSYSTLHGYSKRRFKDSSKNKNDSSKHIDTIIDNDSLNESPFASIGKGQ